MIANNSHFQSLPLQNLYFTGETDKQQILLDSTMRKIKQYGMSVKKGEKIEDTVPYPNSMYPTPLFPVKRILP